jgi:putative oxidoreductase
MGSLMSIMSNKVQFNSLMFIVLGHYVVFAHIVGGILLIIGLFTRFACLIQIPILLVAVLLINAGNNMMRPYSEFFLSLVVLLLLIYFLIVGNGPWSFKLADDERRVRS